MRQYLRLEPVTPIIHGYDRMLSSRRLTFLHLTSKTRVRASLFHRCRVPTLRAVKQPRDLRGYLCCEMLEEAAKCSGARRMAQRG